MMNDADSGRVGREAETGSHPTDQDASHLGASRFDPARVVKAKFVQPTISIEDVDADGIPTGDRFIWVRHEGCPQFDALLATVHYNYAYHDNSAIRGVAERVAAVIAERGPAIAMEAATAGETEGLDPKGAGPARSEAQGDAQ